MENNIVKAKGFINKNGEKVQMIPAEHEHVISEVTGLQNALDGKALSSHSHSFIQDSGDMRAKVECKTINNTDDGAIHLYVEGNDGDSASVNIKYDDIANLNRALKTPSSTPENDATKLITSKAVYESLNSVRNIASFTILRNSTSSNPTFNTATPPTTFVANSIQGRAYACIVTIQVGVGSSAQYETASGVAVWNESEVDGVLKKKVTIYVGFGKFVSDYFTGSSTFPSWTFVEIDSTFFGNSAISSGSGNEQVYPGDIGGDGPDPIDPGQGGKD